MPGTSSLDEPARKASLEIARTLEAPVIDPRFILTLAAGLLLLLNGLTSGHRNPTADSPNPDSDVAPPEA